MILLLILFCLPGLFVFIDFFSFLITGRLWLKRAWVVKSLEFISIVILPFAYLATFDFNLVNDCCSDSAVFSPAHRFSIYVLILFCAAAFFYSSYRKNIVAPVIEIIINALLLTGIVLNVLIGLHTKKEWFLALIGNVPIIMLFVLMMIKNQQLIIQHLQQVQISPTNIIQKAAWKILSLNLYTKIPVLLVLCLPVLIILTGLLLLTGQQPDSLIRAFTDTYKHGLSQLDYMCDNVQCGDHFLCSVAAKGHKQLVKPTRLGIRKQRLILCNRQLLISNAFEELLQQYLPFIHKPVRKAYNQVGHVIHRYYGVFNNKWVSDFVYVVMKPAEWFFLLVLYTFDQKPENRIARQYLGNQPSASSRSMRHIKHPASALRACR